MIAALFSIAICTMILVALFAMPLVPEYPDGYVNAVGWFTDQLAYADHFVDVPTLLLLFESVVAFEIALMTFRVILWGVRILKP